MTKHARFFLLPSFILISAALIAGCNDKGEEKAHVGGNDSNLLIVFYVQIMPDDFVMQLHRF